MGRPEHLSAEWGGQFGDPSVAAAYHHRPPYPPGVFDVLAGLASRTAVVLDVGTGTGEIARPLAPLVGRVDALDPSGEMIARGKRATGGSAADIRWVEGTAEAAPLHPPYDLIVAGASIHWLDWNVVIPRFRDMLRPGGHFAIVDLREPAHPWDEALGEAIRRYSTNRGYRPFDPVEELERRGMFLPRGRTETAAMTFDRTVSEYTESFHARNGFSRDRMPARQAEEFDAIVADLVTPYAEDGVLRLSVVGVVVWGVLS